MHIHGISIWCCYSTCCCVFFPSFLSTPVKLLCTRIEGRHIANGKYILCRHFHWECNAWDCRPIQMQLPFMVRAYVSLTLSIYTHICRMLSSSEFLEEVVTVNRRKKQKESEWNKNCECCCEKKKHTRNNIERILFSMI